MAGRISPLLPSSELVSGQPIGGEAGDIGGRVPGLIVRDSPASGVRTRRVAVPDVSDSSKTFRETTRKLAELDAELLAHPEWRAPSVDVSTGELYPDPDNRASSFIYEGATTREWRRLVPSALALEALALKKRVLPQPGVGIDDAAWRLFLDGDDARAVRTRARLMADLLVARHLTRGRSKGSWVSLACGAARPVFEAIRAVKAVTGDTPAAVHLIDYDGEVLDHARGLADEFSISPTTVVTRQRDLRRDMIASQHLVDDLGANSAQVVDLLGFLEYCPDRAAIALLRAAWRLVAPGGILVTSNMRAERPQRQIHERGIGWPGVQMRTLDELTSLAFSAGVPRALIDLHLPDDDVYAVLTISKPDR